MFLPDAGRVKLTKVHFFSLCRIFQVKFLNYKNRLEATLVEGDAAK